MDKSFVRFLFIMSFITGSCAPSSHQEAQSESTPVDVETTYQPKRPQVTKEEGYDIARGATQLLDVKAHFNPENSSMRLTGAIEYIPVKGGDYQKIELNLVGMYSGGFIVLKPDAAVKIPEGMRVAAKATCLSEGETCNSSFIDIYLYTDGVVYHHQAEVKEEAQDEVKKKSSEAPPVSSPSPSASPSPSPSPTSSSTEVDPQDDEQESDHVDEQQGLFVGSVHKDIEEILNIKPNTSIPVSKEERDESAEAIKKSQPPPVKKEESKKEEPKASKEDPQDGIKKVPVPTPRPKTPEAKSNSDKLLTMKIPESSQAIGAANAGRLENAVDMQEWARKKAPVNFFILRPERQTHFATNEMAYVIDLMGKLTGQLIPGYKLAIGDVSKKNGGSLGKHKSHTNGLDADVAFYFDTKKMQNQFVPAVSSSKVEPHWMLEEQWGLYKNIVRTQLVDRIFLHKSLKQELCKLAIKNGEISSNTKSGYVYETLRRLIPDYDHITHFHVRVKCSSAQIRCRQMREPDAGTGCF